MSRPLRQIASLAGCVLAILPCSAALATETVAPLPESDYTTRRACQAPAPGQAACMALQLLPVTAEARRRTHPLGMVRHASHARPATLTPAGGFLGLRPQDLHSAYSLPVSAPSQQVIAIVDAFNDPTAEADLQTYDEEFGLPACTTANKCFTRVGQTGSEAELPFPKSTAELETFSKGTTAQRNKAKEAIGWGVEISLDVQSAHATCQSCRILLVEAASANNANLVAAERRAVTLGATEISNSWGTPEEAVGLSEIEAFNHPGTVITASAGDNGYRDWAGTEGQFTSFPASSPSVVAVGGTRLRTLGIGGAWQGETVWNGSGASGGGCSTLFTAPAWQQEATNWGAVGCASKRAANDVAADADPYTGFVIRDSDLPGKECQEEYEEGGTIHTIPEWCTYGGTSLASPIIASVFALAGGANAVSYPAQTLYRTLAHAPGKLHDVTVGSNGACGASFNEKTGLSNCSSAEEAAASCSSQLACLAAPGYDGPSGVGTPNGLLGFVPGQEEPPATPAASPPPTTSVTPAPLAVSPSLPPAPVSIPTVQLTGLGLTASAAKALVRAHRRPPASKIAFAFTLNIATSLRVTLARRVRSHGVLRWVTLGRAATLAAVAGRNSKRLSGAAPLSPGRYRLTVLPSGGPARAIAFQVR
jgi:Subtilase family